MTDASNGSDKNITSATIVPTGGTGAEVSQPALSDPASNLALHLSPSPTAARSVEENLEEPLSRLPLPLPMPGEPNKPDPVVLAAWQKHISTGFEQNSQMFKEVLQAFMRPYWMTVWMYRAMFIVGILGFVVAAVLGVWRGVEFALVFGGLSVFAFLTYFVSRPLRSLEQNITFITWLGIIYNIYWTRLMYLNNTTTVQADLEDATGNAITELNQLLDKHEELSGKLPNLPNPQTPTGQNHG